MDSTPPGSAVIAGIGGLVGGLFGLVWVQTGYSGLRVVEKMRNPQYDVDWDGMQVENQLELGIGAVFAVLLGLGGALLLARRPAGLTMVTIGSGLGIFVCLAPLFTATRTSSTIMSVVLALGCVVMLVTALLPATNRWVQSHPNTQLTALNTPRPAVPPYN
ncbi:MAG: hypothetical protein H5T78_06490 [Nocardia sp.]|nr:hypothetical protein [Nocardia sp.]